MIHSVESKAQEGKILPGLFRFEPIPLWIFRLEFSARVLNSCDCAVSLDQKPDFKNNSTSKVF